MMEEKTETPEPLSPEETAVLMKQQAVRLKRIQVISLVFWGVLIAAAWGIFRKLPIVMGVFLGGLIVIINFYWLTRLVQQAFMGKNKPSKLFFVKFGLKFFLLLAIVAFVIYFTPVNPIGFLVGLSVSVAGVVVDGLIGVMEKTR